MSAEQPSKAHNPINFDVASSSFEGIDGIDICSREEQPWNAYSPIDDKNEMIVTLVNEVHSWKAAFSIETTEWIVTFFKEEQPLNVEFPIEFNEESIMTSVSEEHPMNANDSIEVTENGIVIDSKDEHPLNALKPIDTTEEGIDISVISVQSSNEFGPIFVSGNDNKRLMISMLLFSAATCNADILKNNKKRNFI